MIFPTAAAGHAVGFPEPVKPRVMVKPGVTVRRGVNGRPAAAGRVHHMRAQLNSAACAGRDGRDDAALLHIGLVRKPSIAPGRLRT